MRAIKKLKALGTGFSIIPVGGTYLIQSVPAELNMDHTVVLQLAEVGYAFQSTERQPGPESGAVPTCPFLGPCADCLVDELLWSVLIQHIY